MMDFKTLEKGYRGSILLMLLLSFPIRLSFAGEGEKALPNPAEPASEVDTAISILISCGNAGGASPEIPRFLAHFLKDFKFSAEPGKSERKAKLQGPVTLIDSKGFFDLQEVWNVKLSFEKIRKAVEAYNKNLRENPPAYMPSPGGPGRPTATANLWEFFYKRTRFPSLPCDFIIPSRFKEVRFKLF